MATITAKRFEGLRMSLNILYYIIYFPNIRMIESIYSNTSSHIGATIIQRILHTHEERF